MVATNYLSMSTKLKIFGELGRYMIFATIIALGIYISVFKRDIIVEKFTSHNKSDNSSNCPNILMQKGDKLYLYNSKRAMVPGVNPIQFDNLEEYTEFIEWQRANGLRCPILFMRESYDAQGSKQFKVHADPSNQTAGESGIPANASANASANKHPLMDAGREDPIYNKGSYPSFDPNNQYIGKNVPLDSMENEHASELDGMSGNPMDTNWGGTKYTQNLVKSGIYAGNTRHK